MTTMFKRRKSASPTGRGPFERFLFSFMGPPQLGDVNAPSTYQADPRASLCHKCGEPWDDHQRVQAGNWTYKKCPRPQG